MQVIPEKSLCQREPSGCPGGFLPEQGCFGSPGEELTLRHPGLPGKGVAISGLQKENCPTAEIGSEPQDYNKQLPGQGPWLFSLCFGSERKIYFVCCSEFFSLVLFSLLLWRYLKPRTPPRPGWGCCSPGCVWAHGGVSATFWDVFKAHPLQTCRAFVASR